MPGDQAPIRLVAQQRLAEHGRNEIVEKEHELRADARSAAAGAIERHDRFGCDLPGDSHVGEAGIHGGGGALSERGVEAELDQGHELIERLFFRRPTGKSAGQVVRAVLQRKTPMQNVHLRHKRRI